MHNSWAPSDFQGIKTISQPVPVPVHRRSKSSFEYRGSPSSTSTTFSTPDMVPDIDQPSGNVVSIIIFYKILHTLLYM